MAIKLSKPRSVGMCAARLERIDTVMQEQVDQGTLAGVSTLVARRGKVVHFKQFGMRDRETNLPMQADTIVRMYSMTKPIVCTAFMTLYEQGKVDLFDPVSKFIPAFKNLNVLESSDDGSERLVDLKRPMTIQHLLTHTSGLVYDFFEDSPVCQLYRDKKVCADLSVSAAEFVAKLSELPLAFQPGERWFYGVNTDVLGHVIEIISGQSLAEFLQTTILSPLSMHDTAYCQPADKLSRVAAIYGSGNICEEDVSWSDLVGAWEQHKNIRLDLDSGAHPVDDPSFQWGGLGLSSTMEDYYRFTQMLLNGGELGGQRVLSPKTVELMHLNHLPQKLLPMMLGGQPLSGYGFGLGSRVMLDVAASGVAGSVGEFGWGGAAKTYYWIDPKEELIGIFLTQSMGNFSLIQRTFQALVYQAMIG